MNIAREPITCNNCLAIDQFRLIKYFVNIGKLLTEVIIHRYHKEATWPCQNLNTYQNIVPIITRMKSWRIIYAIILVPHNLDKDRSIFISLKSEPNLRRVAYQLALFKNWVFRRAVDITYSKPNWKWKIWRGKLNIRDSNTRHWSSNRLIKVNSLHASQ